MLARLLALTTTLCAVQFSAALADPITLTDIAGREVTVEAPAKRIILGEGRQIYLLGALEREDPFARVVGWREDLHQADPDTYAAYAAKFPQLKDLPTFGGFKDGTFDVEQAAALKPDVMLMNLESKAATEDAGYDKKLAALGIPIVYVDFREDPVAHSVKSMEIMGKLVGKEDRAKEYVDFVDQQMKRVTDVIAKSDIKRPLVFVDRAGGYSDDCCMTFGNGNFGEYVEIAGGTNIAKDILPTTFGTLNPEQIIAANPDQVIVTGGQWEAYVPGGAWVGVGPGSDMKAAHDKLEALTKRTAMTGIKAVDTGNFHAIWHQFYDNPYYFVAVQQLAKWLQPELFADLDPEATLKELHTRFLPVDYQPGYWVSLNDK
ncbi:ABC transporter substrate-binding protein [Paracoccus aestuariivivens]|uniref:ABC transporter substrate-binding protein n=1 Tax=Paracoccus aestuariivivens TaxID=1820333 RepID=A0A6L6J389_9RHOB|nr:ABC transporter substrate-binding protein [Paracoccus aestuariivivens]MTH76562.1 ABC transporter substrate-binding protein [Paracoccus aestuariivivens]